MMLLCNSIAPPGDDLSEGGREKLQTALLPFFATDDDKTDDGDAELLPFPFLQVTARARAPPPPFSAECRQNIKISERYRITRALPSLSDHLHVLLRHQKQLGPRSELDSESNPAFLIILKINSFLSFHQEHPLG